MTKPCRVTRQGYSRSASAFVAKLTTMDGQEAFRRLARQLRSAGGGGPGGPGKGVFAGSGLLIALVAGGFVLNASLFNGMSSTTSISPGVLIFCSGWWPPCNQVQSVSPSTTAYYAILTCPVV